MNNYIIVYNACIHDQSKPDMECTLLLRVHCAIKLVEVDNLVITINTFLPSLTRFNKICHPSQRPRWQVDKEAIGLSRVQQCSSTYSPPS